jgi:hypothetical protein
MRAMKTVKTRLAAAVQIVGLVVFTQACFKVGQDALPGSPTSAESLLGEWRSVNGDFPGSESCRDLVWNVTSETESSIAGSFEAKCDDGITLNGTATGNRSGDDIDIEVIGTATGFGVALCNFTLRGKGVLQPDGTIRVDYTGETCLGPVSGTEVIRR